ncbi:allantoinase AllB [Streptomyces lunaelactis]|uniref:allantoinase AllB n=1 Tax=Streptomyces lunaelactis TaxID=1535768 RepID=UPI0015855F2D|nr:allantoinase AllB [Streptomyces lunaelactis]NUK11242.1 allantoinase AllB [Streptomyces lunaelactis]NUK26281.1 allantoinase AllB [Streptomyces lunaelactis]NUK37633.1 allantoinase AllB [Streptomyces lunaelactis]NUK44426.1 allantoinase AllB [Streptomyces lunaelactis]NUK60658.1 allantoinase AllB [Streptomyces lunaelactis]
MSDRDVNLVLRSTRVITPEGTRAASVSVAAGKIVAVQPYAAEVPAGARLEDFGDDVVLPGLVDTHVHVNDPGRTEWEGFWTATRAAAAGGITTLLDMPLNSLPPTTTVGNLRTKQDVARPKAHVDTGFWGGAIPSNVKDLRPLYDAGVFGFKCFLSPSGVEEFPELDQEQLARSMAEIAGFGGLLIVHAEDPHQLAAAPQESGPKYADFLASRPRDAENTAIEGLIAAAKRHGARVHVLHLSSSDALPPIAAAKREGVRISVESCPHFLTLTAEEVPDGATEFKCCPPIREAENQDALWEGLADGTIDCIVSDHSPCTTDLKTPDFASAWGGISSLQLGLPAIWTEARKRGHTLEDVVRWMSAAPAELAGLDQKGAIEAGRDADFAVLAPDETFTVDPAELHHRNQVTAYAGKTLHGVVRSTWLRGERIVENGTLAEPTGRLLERNI